MKNFFPRANTENSAILYYQFIEFLEYLQEQDVEWIVLRSHEEIHSNLNIYNDIDLLIKKDHLFKVANYAKIMGWHQRLDSCWNNKYLYGAFPHFHIVSIKTGLHIDIVSNLSYRSPNNGEWVKVHELIQASMWANKLTVNEPWKYIPAEVDELLHIVCHCMLDKKDFSDKYRKRIMSLGPYLNDARFKELLGLVFFSYSDVLQKKLTEMDFHQLPQEYTRFSKY